MDQVSQGAGLLRTMKKRAAELRAAASAAGKTTTHSAALEAVAHERGFRDWNAAAAATKAASRNTPPSWLSAPIWREQDQPLPVLMPRVVNGDRSFYESIRELMRWAIQAQGIADGLLARSQPEPLGRMGGDPPYVFVQDRSRWGDDLYRLCGRGYEPWTGIVFNHDELAVSGVVEWEHEHGNHGGTDMFSVAWDEPLGSRDPATLKGLARLLAGIALVADEAYVRQMGEVVPRGKGFTIDLNDPAQLTTMHVARLIGSRDDSVNREVRVTKAGVAYVSDVVGNVDTGNLAFGLGAWIAGNGYVGLKAARDADYIQQILRELVLNWPEPTEEVNDWTW